MTVFVNFVKESEDIPAPKYETKGAAGFDLRSAEDVEIPPDKTVIISTGLRFAVPRNYEMQIRSRSGLAAKNNIHVLNSPGCIDPSYTGIVKIILHNADRWLSFKVNKGDRIAQGIICPAPVVKFLEVQELEKTERGDGGLGSTGIQ